MSPLRGFLDRIAGRRSAATDDARPGPGADQTERASRGRGGRRDGRNNQQADQTDSRAQTSSRDPRRGGDRSRQDSQTTSPTSERATTDRGRDGSRDSRGRGSQDSSSPTQETRSRGYSWGKRAGDDDEARKALNDRRNDRTRRRGRFRPAGKLDAPLPEDVAFRPADAGGDNTILPSRRRRPKGLRTTERVLVGGARLITAAV
ncbi:MAG: hypothetical protein O3B31_07615, partial [Chloroflexi bacterium]|nr:hypothetical protein [Chloroflexota bacterium]